MAKVKITGHASGTGILTVTAPNTSTDRTITLPDSTGTLLDENASLPAANLTGTVASARITAGSIANDLIDSQHYAAGSIDNEHIADDAIDSEHYADGSIDNAHIADDAIDSEHYADGSIDLAHLSADCVDGTKIADDSINSEHYVDGSIDSAHIGDLQVLGAKLALDRKSANSTDDVEMGNPHDYMFADADIGLRWFTAGAEEMRLEDDGDLHVDGDVIAFSTTVPSSIALKDNVNIIDNALEKLNLLRGVSFNYKRDGRESAGVIAEEVQDVLPQAVKSVVNLKDESKNLAVNYNALTSILIEAIKELTAKVEKLENK